MTLRSAESNACVDGVRRRTGTGSSVGQHGELFQGQIKDQHDRLHRCLMSLPCRALSSRAVFRFKSNGQISVTPSHKQKARKVAELTLSHFKISGVGGALTIESAIPEAKGYGSSTADCVATVLAIADALSQFLEETEVARLVVEAEIASDNFMFRQAVLFAHREGVVLEHYGKRIPKLEVLGIDTAQDQYVKTLEYPPAVYSRRQLESFRILRSALRRAVLHQDVRLLGRVATASACINEEFLKKTMFQEIRKMAEHCGALGTAVAHSGTVLSILLDAADELLEAKIDRIQRELEQLGTAQPLRFQT